MDGTLVDSAVAIMSRLEDTMREFGAIPPDSAELRHLIGPPTRQALGGYIPEAQMDEAVAFYKALALREGSTHTHLFPGIRDALAALADADIPLALATSKPQDEAERLAKEFGIAEYLQAVVGASSERPRKADVIGRGLSLLHATSTASQSPLMVGDRSWDVEGAAEHHVPTILVRWGYAREAEFAVAFADVHTVDELVAFVCGGAS